MEVMTALAALGAAGTTHEPTSEDATTSAEFLAVLATVVGVPADAAASVVDAAAVAAPAGRVDAVVGAAAAIGPQLDPEALAPGSGPVPALAPSGDEVVTAAGSPTTPPGIPQPLQPTANDDGPDAAPSPASDGSMDAPASAPIATTSSAPVGSAAAPSQARAARDTDRPAVTPAPGTETAAADATAPETGAVEAPGEPDGPEPAAPRPTRPAAPGAPAAPHAELARTGRAAATVHGATPSVPDTRPLERAIAAQLVQRIGVLTQRDEGEYELTLQLEPAELGRLEVRVRLEGGVVHLQVGAHAKGTAEVVREALPELRAALVEAGLTAGQLDVGQHGAPHRDHQPLADPAPAQRASTTPRPATTATPTVRTIGADRGVDVLL